ncbi:MAG: outer membrane lipoprotein LolB [Gammaproteobacteria bacterium]|nr:outer membrane lipoprotein LolB [Gammaproteobacteria bacterium]
MRAPALALCALLLGVGGCAAMPKLDHARQADANWARRAKALSRIDTFSLQARVASGGLFGASGDLDWQQQGEAFDLRFSGPFGVGGIEIAGTVEDVQVRTRKNTYRTEDPDAFLRQKLGLNLPVSGLRYWVLGVPSPHSDADLILDAGGRAEQLVQDGWTLRYETYETIAGLSLPTRFEINGGRTRFKVVVDRWSGVTTGG